MEAQNGNTSNVFLQSCVAQFKATITQEFQEIAASSQQRVFTMSLNQIQRIDNLTQMLRSFSQLCKPSQRQPIIEQIILNEENFGNCEANCLPMKLFRDIFLQGGIAFDVQKLFSKEGGFKYAWLASLLLNINNLNSLNNFPDLKKQLIVFLDTEVIPALIIAL